MARTPQLAPEDQYPQQAIDQSVQIQRKPEESDGPGFTGYLTLMLSSVADNMPAWGTNVLLRDQELRRFWPTESFLAGAIYSIGARDAGYDWEIHHTSTKVEQSVTDMLKSAISGKNTVGWVPFMERVSQDLNTQDNGAFIEIIRDPVMDATSVFHGPMAPVIGIAHLDSGRCRRTGNAKYPVVYVDDNDRKHKLAWYQVIPFSDFPSPIEKMNGVGYCGVTRSLRLAQIVKSIMLFKDEKISGRHFKSIHFVSGPQNKAINDAIARTKENADNAGQIRYIDPVIVASLDPEKPISTATIDFASLPDGFDMNIEMQWYISGLALDFGTDYQDFAPLPGGNIGSSEQSLMLNRKSSGKGPRARMRMFSEAFKNYGVIPRGAEQIYNDKNQQEELEAQSVRTKALEEIGMAINSNVLTPEAAARELVRRGIYTAETIRDIPPEFWKAAADTKSGANRTNLNMGGTTFGEDNKRVDAARTGVVNGLKKFFGRDG